MYCPKCKKHLEKDARFCPDCGVQAISLKKCGNCGKELPPGSRYCPECGMEALCHTQTRKPEENKVPEREESISKGPDRNTVRKVQPEAWTNPPKKKGVAAYTYVPKRKPQVKEKNIPKPEQAAEGFQEDKTGRKKNPIPAILGICGTIVIVVAFVAIAIKLMGGNNNQQGVQTTNQQQTASQGNVETDSGESSRDDSSDSQDSESDNPADTGVVNVLGDQNTSDSEGTVDSQNVDVQTSKNTKDIHTSIQKADQQAAVSTGSQLDMEHMANLIGGTGATYSLYILDITNSQEYDNGTGDSSLPASALIGIPILFTVAEGVNSGIISLDSQVEFHYTFVNGRGTYKSEDNGRTFPISQMLADALANSDNNALNSLMDFLTLDKINQTCHAYGFTSVNMQRKLETGASTTENYISAKDAALMLNAVYQDNFTGIGKAFLEQNFKIQGSDTANKGMYPACSSCSIFLNLNGIREDKYNEVGLIQNGDEVFILSILTCNGEADTSAAAVTNAASYAVSTLKVQ